MRKIISTLAVGSLLLWGAAFAQDETSQGMPYADFDASGDASVDRTEFGTAFSQGGLYGAFDADMSGTVDQTEFASGLFLVLDADGSGSLDESELGGLSLWGGELTLADLDTDASGDVSLEEFSAGYDATETFGAFDTDASGDLSDTEFSEGVFGLVDADADQAITEEEFNAQPNLFRNFGTQDDAGGAEGAEGEDGAEGGNGEGENEEGEGSN